MCLLSVSVCLSVSWVLRTGGKRFVAPRVRRAVRRGASDLQGTPRPSQVGYPTVPSSLLFDVTGLAAGVSGTILQEMWLPLAQRMGPFAYGL